MIQGYSHQVELVSLFQRENHPVITDCLEAYLLQWSSRPVILLLLWVDISSVALKTRSTTIFIAKNASNRRDKCNFIGWIVCSGIVFLNRQRRPRAEALLTGYALIVCQHQSIRVVFNYTSQNGILTNVMHKTKYPGLKMRV